MSVRGLLVGAIVLCVLAGAVYWSEKNEGTEQTKQDENKVVAIKDEDVRKIQIERTGEPTVSAEREKGAAWKITEPKPLRADAEAVSSLVSTFTGMTQGTVVEEKPTNLAPFGLSNPRLKVTLAGGNEARTLLVGDETPTGGGYFAKLANDPRVFTIYGYTKTSLDKTAIDLRDKRLLNIDDAKLTRVEVSSKDRRVEFGKNAQGEWQFVKPQPWRADNLLVDELVRKVKDARMESVPEDQAQKAPARFASGIHVASVSLTDASGTQSLEVRKAGDEYFARSTATEGIYKVSNEVGEELSKNLDEFRNKKLFDFGWAEPTKVEIRDGDKAYHLVKGGDKWWSNGKAMDSTSVQSLIDKLRDLTATRFVEGGFPGALIEITVTSDNGKRVEKVLIAKTGSNYLAKRENEPTVYQLESDRVEEVQRAAADVKEPPPPPAK
jgi:hypothetical protein